MPSKFSDPRKLYPAPPFPSPEQPPPGLETEMDPKADHGEGSYEGRGRLTGRRALITGADSGIGRAVALAFAREGADVAISYLSEHDDAKETERLVTDAGRRALLLPGDIASAVHCREIVSRTATEFGGLEILVINAAHQGTFEKMEDITDEEFERHYQVNVFAMFYLSKAALALLPPGGSIINTSSIQSFDPSETLIPYASTKSAISSFTRSLANLAIKQGVRVNAVAPGPVWTPLIPSTMPPKKVKSFGVQSAFGRPAQPAELAPLYVFLASAEASYVTGEIYGATGGVMPL